MIFRVSGLEDEFENGQAELGAICRPNDVRIMGRTSYGPESDKLQRREQESPFAVLFLQRPSQQDPRDRNPSGGDPGRRTKKRFRQIPVGQDSREDEKREKRIPSENGDAPRPPGHGVTGLESAEDRPMNQYRRQPRQADAERIRAQKGEKISGKVLLPRSGGSRQNVPSANSEQQRRNE